MGTLRELARLAVLLALLFAGPGTPPPGPLSTVPGALCHVADAAGGGTPRPFAPTGCGCERQCCCLPAAAVLPDPASVPAYPATRRIARRRGPRGARRIVRTLPPPARAPPLSRDFARPR